MTEIRQQKTGSKRWSALSDFASTELCHLNPVKRPYWAATEHEDENEYDEENKISSSSSCS
jgi:hypothetical protein